MDSTLVSLLLLSFWMSWCIVHFPAVYSEEVTIKDESMTDWFSLKFSSYRGSTGADWERQMSGAVRTCGTGERAEYWFLTHLVNLTATSAEIIYVDVEAALKKESCFDPDNGYVQCYSNYFEIYIYRGKDEINVRPRIMTPAEILSTLRVFSSLYNVTNNTLPNTNVTKNTQTFSFHQNKSQGVTFAILSRGACGTLFRMKMYHYRCNETFYNGIRFETTISANERKTVVGKCSKNSTTLNNATSVERYCYANGKWSISVNESLKCLCIEGHALDRDGRCSRCLDTHYKKNISNGECTECPENTVSNTNRTSCDCNEDFYSLPNSNPESFPCYALPELNGKPAVLRNANRVNISWIKPENSVKNLTIFYDVECYNCSQTNISCMASCSNVGYDPSQSNLSTTSVLVLNLQYGKSYVFRVYARNSLNDQIGREKWNYTETDRVDVTHEPTKTTKKPATSEDDSSLYIIIGAVCVLVLILIAFILIYVFRRKSRGNKSASGYTNRGVELPDVGRRLYVNPRNYEDPEAALVEFTNELDSKLVFLERMIGGGEFGDVYKGELTTKDKKKIPIAAKTLKHDADEKSKRDFTLEASILGQFDNENIVRLEGVLTKSTPRMIILEYMSNGSLDNYLKSNDSMLTSLQLIGMARGVAGGMKYLAEMNFVHRDLAARNILVNENLLCKIADFGLSRELEMKETSRAEYSTHGGKIPVRWTAPEAIKLRKFSSASDVWSFGIVLWEIMSFAERPYWEWGNFKVLEELDSGYRLPPPHNCPKGVHELMLHCWKADRNERPSFARITVVIDQWIRSPETLDDEITSLTPIGEWLALLKMSSYESKFIDAGYKRKSQVIDLTDEDLKDLGVTLVGHRNKIKKGIDSLCSLKRRESLTI